MVLIFMVTCVRRSKWETVEGNITADAHENFTGGGEGLLLLMGKKGQGTHLHFDWSSAINAAFAIGTDGMGWDGMGWDGIVWDCMGWDGM